MFPVSIDFPENKKWIHFSRMDTWNALFLWPLKYFQLWTAGHSAPFPEAA